MSLIPVVGMDPSMTNWGIAQGTYCTDTGAISITHLDVVRPEPPSGKQVRVSSKDVVVATQLCTAAVDATRDAQITFVEMPSGTQSARGCISNGLCFGILGALKAGNVPFIEITPKEVKKATYGLAMATKKQMIEWAMAQHPDANWPMHTYRGEQRVSEGQAEHMADAIAAIHAGIAGDEFQKILPFIHNAA